MDVTLSRLAEFQEKAQKIKNKVISAMVYPSVVIFVALSILVFLMVVIVPKFQDIFRDLLKRPTAGTDPLVIASSNLVKDQALLVVGVIVGLVIALKFFGKTAKRRYILDKIKLNSRCLARSCKRWGLPVSHEPSGR